MPLRTLYPLPRLPGFSTSRSAGFFAAKVSNNFCRVVARSVVDDDDFRIPAAGMHVGQHLFESCAQARALVIGGNHDAISGLQKRFSVLSGKASTGRDSGAGNSVVIVLGRFRISEIRIRRRQIQRGLRFKVRERPQATRRCCSSMEKYSATKSVSHRPRLASSRIVWAACSCVSGGL